MNKLTHARLVEMLAYNPDTGVFTRRTNLCNGIEAGAVAGNLSREGYVRIAVDRASYLAHRLAMFYTDGVWPLADVDHISGDRTDNRRRNLRNATRAENGRNRKRHATSKSGIKGVSWDRESGKWRAQICVAGRVTNLGRFADAGDAAEAYNRAARLAFGEFTRAAA